jgi:hypothetical protein
VLSAFRGLGFADSEVDEIFAFLAAILQVGELTFKPEKAASEPGCLVDNGEAAAQIATLWNVTADDLHSSFTSHSIEVRGELLRGKLRAAEALDGCAAAAKHVYGALFAHIVRRVNELLDGPRGHTVGVLDIFGFEIFETNSFEQARGSTRTVPHPLAPHASSPHEQQPHAFMTALSCLPDSFVHSPPMTAAASLLVRSCASTMPTRSCSSSFACTPSSRRRLSMSLRTSHTITSSSSTTRHAQRLSLFSLFDRPTALFLVLGSFFPPRLSPCHSPRCELRRHVPLLCHVSRSSAGAHAHRGASGRSAALPRRRGFPWRQGLGGRFHDQCLVPRLTLRPASRVPTD